MDRADIIKIVILCVAIVLGLISRVWLPKDNPVEQVAEEVIKVETGADIDLSPEN